MATGVKELDILRSMQYMLEAGMSMHEIIYELAATIKNRKLADKLDVVDDLMVNQGAKFSDALESAALFEEYIPIIRTGQETGALGRVINEILGTAEKIESLRKKVKSMTVYPIMLMFISIALGFGISFLLQKILTSLPERDIKGTTPYAIAHFIVSYRVYIFSAYAMALAGALVFISKNASRIPIVSKLFNMVTVGQAFKLISLCIKNGLPLKDTFLLVAAMVKEKRWQGVMELLAVESQQRNFYDLVEELSDFITTPDLLIIKSNIKAGNMSNGFDFVGDRKIEDSYAMIERLAPVMQIAAYFFVAGQIVAIMSPLYAILISYAGKV